MNDFMTFVKNDIKQYDSDVEIHVIVPDTTEYLREYPDVYNNERIKFHFLDTNSGMVVSSIERDDYITKGKKGIIYSSSIGVDTERIENFNPSARVYRNNSAASMKLIFN